MHTSRLLVALQDLVHGKPPLAITGNVQSLLQLSVQYLCHCIRNNCSFLALTLVVLATVALSIACATLYLP